jgi:hypothetical protein
MKLEGKTILLACGILSAAIALYHVGFLAFSMGEEYDPRLPELTVTIALLFVVFSAYAFSGAGAVRRLPLLKAGLAVPAAIYTLYGTALLLQRAHVIPSPAELDWTNIVFGGVVGIGALALGIGHFIGLRRISTPNN